MNPRMKALVFSAVLLEAHAIYWLGFCLDDPLPLWAAILALPVVFCGILGVACVLLLGDIQRDEAQVRKDRSKRKLNNPHGDTL